MLERIADHPIKKIQNCSCGASPRPNNPKLARPCEWCAEGSGSVQRCVKTVASDGYTDGAKLALVFNWCSLCVRLAFPGKHAEAVKSRPALVYGVAKKTTHQNQEKVTITSCHGKAEVIESTLQSINRFLNRFAASAEQLSRPEPWARLIRIILREFYRGHGAEEAVPQLA